MKNILLSLMISTLLLSCAERYNNERIQFSNILLNNLDSSAEILRSSEYYCGKDQIMDKAWRDTNRSSSFIYVNDREEIIGVYKVDYARDTSIFMGWDTVHFVVFQNKFFDNYYSRYISLEFKKSNSKWCFIEASFGDAVYSLDNWHIDY